MWPRRRQLLLEPANRGSRKNHGRARDCEACPNRSAKFANPNRRAQLGERATAGSMRRGRTGGSTFESYFETRRQRWSSLLALLGLLRAAKPAERCPGLKPMLNLRGPVLRCGGAFAERGIDGTA